MENIIKEFHSDKRFDEYKVFAKPNKELDLYLKNIEVSEYFYGIIMHFEIMLRNKIHVYLSTKYTSDWRNHIITVIPNLVCEKHTENLANINIFISRQNLGYWIKIINIIGIDMGLSTQQTKDIEKVRKFRNRIFHFESIVKDLNTLHNNRIILKNLIKELGSTDYKNFVYNRKGINWYLLEKIHI